MVCIYCGSRTSVENSRPQAKSNSVWRRRQCQHCHTVFTTRETVDYSGSIVVSKKSGHLEPFSRDKLYISIYDSLKHRKTALRDATALSETIISRLLKHQSHGELKNTLVKDEAGKVLKRFDKVAFTHYLAFHP